MQTLRRKKLKEDLKKQNSEKVRINSMNFLKDIIIACKFGKNKSNKKKHNCFLKQICHVLHLSIALMLLSLCFDHHSMLLVTRNRWQEKLVSTSKPIK